jgi:hypothetical protein
MNNEKLTQKIGNDVTFKFHTRLNGYPCLKIYKHSSGDTMVMFTKANYGICIYSSHPDNLFIGGQFEFTESLFETFDGELTLTNFTK